MAGLCAARDQREAAVAARAQRVMMIMNDVA
jgi:hypothetical protein